MKNLPLAFCLMAASVFSVRLAGAHESKPVQTEEKARESLLPEGFAFEGGEPAWQELTEEALPDVPKLEALALATAETSTSGATVRLGRFKVQGDWGPIQAIAAVREGTVLGVEILTFTEHVGDDITQPVFLKQFREISLADIESAELKPLPREPQTVEALRAGLIGMNMALASGER